MWPQPPAKAERGQEGLVPVAWPCVFLPAQMGQTSIQSRGQMCPRACSWQGGWLRLEALQESSTLSMTSYGCP